MAASRFEEADGKIQGFRKRNYHESQSWERKSQTIIDEVLEAQCRQLWELKTPGGPSHIRIPQFCEIYLQELEQVLTENIREKPSRASNRGRKKGIVLKHARALRSSSSCFFLLYTVFFLKRFCPQKKIVNQDLNCWGIIKSLTDLEEALYNSSRL